MAQDVPDAQDLEVLFEEHGPAVRKLLQRLLGPSGDADDLIQDVFLHTWKRRDALAAGAARSYLFSTAIKMAANARKLVRVRRMLGLEAAVDVPDRSTPHRAIEQAEASRIVYAVLDGLSDKRRTVFILHEIQQMTGEEISRALGCPMNTVFTRLFWARRDFMERVKAIRAELDRQGRR